MCQSCDQLRRALNKRDAKIVHLQSQISAMKLEHMISGAVSYPDKVYVIGAMDHDFVKIGISADVEKRLKNLQSPNSHPESSIDNLRILFQYEVGIYARNAERFIHTKLRKFRARGEWFRLMPAESVSIVKGLLQEWGSTRAA